MGEKDWSFDDFNPDTDMAPEGSEDDCDGTMKVPTKGVDLGDERS